MASLLSGMGLASKKQTKAVAERTQPIGSTVLVFLLAYTFNGWAGFKVAIATDTYPNGEKLRMALIAACTEVMGMEMVGKKPAFLGKTFNAHKIDTAGSPMFGLWVQSVVVATKAIADKIAEIVTKIVNDLAIGTIVVRMPEAEWNTKALEVHIKHENAEGTLAVAMQGSATYTIADFLGERGDNADGDGTKASYWVFEEETFAEIWDFISTLGFDMTCTDSNAIISPEQVGEYLASFTVAS
jgi:hypothetical protein